MSSVRPGYISIKAYPTSKENLLYDLRLMEFGVNAMASMSPELEPYADRVLKAWKDEDGLYVFMPCVVSRDKKTGKYKATLMVPPETEKTSNFFASEFIVPGAGVCNYAYGRHGDASGYLLKSPYLGSQLLYTGIKSIPEGELSGTFQVVIKRVNGPERKSYPNVVVIHRSERNHIVKQNEEMMRKMAEEPVDFWWEMPKKGYSHYGPGKDLYGMPDQLLW